MPFLENAKGVVINGGKFNDINGQVTKYKNSTIPGTTQTTSTSNSHNDSWQIDNSRNNNNYHYRGPAHVFTAFAQTGGPQAHQQSGNNQLGQLSASQQRYLQQQMRTLQLTLQQNGLPDYSSAEDFGFDLNSNAGLCKEGEVLNDGRSSGWDDEQRPRYASNQYEQNQPPPFSRTESDFNHSNYAHGNYGPPWVGEEFDGGNSRGWGDSPRYGHVGNRYHGQNRQPASVHTQSDFNPDNYANGTSGHPSAEEVRDDSRARDWVDEQRLRRASIQYEQNQQPASVRMQSDFNANIYYNRNLEPPSGEEVRDDGRGWDLDDEQCLRHMSDQYGQNQLPPFARVQSDPFPAPYNMYVQPAPAPFRSTNSFDPSHPYYMMSEPAVSRSQDYQSGGYVQRRDLDEKSEMQGQDHA